MIRVQLPFHLQTLAGTGAEIELSVPGRVTVSAILDALEAEYPMLKGTIREHVTLRRRPRVRFFADREDVSFASPDTELPPSIADGSEPFMIVGAVSGG